MAGLAAAWQLSNPGSGNDVEVTVYQRGWRLGGKGASSRGVHGRVEEHGLHVWLGYYDNAFRLIRHVYDELDRSRTDPTCAIQDWREGFAPADQVGVEDFADGRWSHWIAEFRRQPGEPGDLTTTHPTSSVAGLVERGFGLLLDFTASLQARRLAPVPVGVVLSGSPVPPRRSTGNGGGADLDQFLRQAEIAALIGAVEALRLAGRVPSASATTGFVLARLARWQRELTALSQGEADLRRSGQLANLVLTCLQGVVRDGLLTDPRGFSAIDDVDFRDWLRRHGAAAETCASPLLQGLYDLVFAYEEGDRGRPRFAAGLGLFLAGKLFFDYHGSIFWRLTAGMGDVVFAPLYQALRARGVRFRFFHRVHGLHLRSDRQEIASITLGRQAELTGGSAEYDPLIRIKDLPCYPAAPRREQLDREVPLDLESHWSDRTTEQVVELHAGTDFDVVVLATSIGMVRHVCPELIADSPRWRDMVDRIATVPTQALQVWLRRSESELGWRHPGATVSGFVSPFDTYASMSHLVPREDWPDDEGVCSLGYFCSVLAKDAERDPAAAERTVLSHAVEFLDLHVGHFWPGARLPAGGFRWDLLPAFDATTGPDRLASQYTRANVDPSDQYVQCLPGSSAYRLRADESGYRNLYLAGDWINSGLNAGCVEAAVMSGIEAANAVLGRPLMTGVLGDWWGVATP